MGVLSKLYADSESDVAGLIGGYSDSDGYAAQVISDYSTSSCSLPSPGTSFTIQSVAINETGIGLVGGYSGASTNAYVAKITADGTATQLGITTPLYISSVAINSSGIGLVGGCDNYQVYAAKIAADNSITTIPLPTTVDSAWINSVALNNSNVGLIGGKVSTDYGAYVSRIAADNTATTITLTDVQQYTAVTSVAINSSGLGIIGGGHGYKYSLYVAKIAANSSVATPVTTPEVTSVWASVNSAAINDSGTAIIGGYYYDNTPRNNIYVAAIAADAFTTTPLISLFASDSDAISSVSINSSGVMLAGGNLNGTAYVARITADHVVSTISLPGLGSSSVNSVSINDLGVGLVGGLNNNSAYAAVIAPNGEATQLTLSSLGSLSCINSVAINNTITSYFVPKSVGLYTSAINTQLSFCSALNAHFTALNGMKNESSAMQKHSWFKQHKQSQLTAFNEVKKKSSATQRTSWFKQRKQPHLSLQKTHNIWVAPLGNYTRIQKQGKIPTFTNEVIGMLAAYEYNHSNFQIGGGLGYAFNYVHCSESLGHGYIQEEVSCLYGSYQHNHFWFDVALWAGVYQYHNDRHVLFTFTSKTHTHGWLLSPHIELAVPFGFGYENKYSVEPFVMCDWVHNRLHRFTESSASGLSLVMGSQYTSLLQSEGGVRFYEKLQSKEGQLLLEEKLSYINMTPFHFHGVNTYFVGSASTFAVAIGSSKMEHLGGVQLQGTFFPKHSTTYFGWVFNGEFNPSYQSYFTSLHLGKKF
jgi:hypothetical protein